MDVLELEHYAQLLQTGHRAKDQLKRMVKAHQTAVMQLSAAQLELQSAKAAAANELKQHTTRLQDKLQDRYRKALQLLDQECELQQLPISSSMQLLGRSISSLEQSVAVLQGSGLQQAASPKQSIKVLTTAMQQIHNLVQQGQAALEHSSSQAESAGQHQFEVVEQFKQLRVSSGSKARLQCRAPAGCRGTGTAACSAINGNDAYEQHSGGDKFSSSRRQQLWQTAPAGQLMSGYHPQHCSCWDCCGGCPEQQPSQQQQEQQCSRRQYSHQYQSDYHHHQQQQQHQGHDASASAELLPERWQTAPRPARQSVRGPQQVAAGAPAHASQSDSHTLQQLAAERQYEQQQLAAREAWQAPAAAAECACCSQQDAEAVAHMHSSWRLMAAPEHSNAVQEQQQWRTVHQLDTSAHWLPAAAVRGGPAAAAEAQAATGLTATRRSLDTDRLSGGRRSEQMPMQPQQVLPEQQQQQQQRKAPGAGFRSGVAAGDAVPAADKGLLHAVQQQQQQGSSWGSWREHAAQVLGDSQVLGGRLAPDGSAELPPSAAQLVRRRSTLRQALAGQQHTPATKED
uniref:Uncharacterized protein n=1 Tax=Tetradesmus obliquus TaxID=3088 RepID=A0A383V818_TETOB|eukprot:jgi/Sobl393_1/9720/SZX61090.1